MITKSPGAVSVVTLPFPRSIVFDPFGDTSWICVVCDSPKTNVLLTLDVVVTAFGTVLLAVANTDVVVVLNSVLGGKLAAGNVVTEGIMVVVEAESTRLDVTVVEVLVVEFVIFVPSGQPPVGAGTTSPTCE